MNYQLKHDLKGEILEITISGRSTDSRFLENDVREIVSKYPAKNIFFDVRRLAGQSAIEEMDLNLDKHYGDQGKSKIAVLDSEEYSYLYSSVYTPAPGRGANIRFFSSQAEATNWLNS